MGWFKRQCLSWIIVFAAAICVSYQELTSTLREGNRACPEEEVTFTCTVRVSSGVTIALAWSSTEYIGQGGLLQFATTNSPGAEETSVVNRNVIATLTNNTVIDGGMRVLESRLRIVAVQASTVTCDVTSRGPVSIQFNISAVPGAPRNVRAAEISRIDTSCVILVQWDPPAGSDGSDIDHYVVYVPSRNMNNTESSAITFLRVPSCRDDDSILVAAVNRFGCAGMNSSEIQPILFPNLPTTKSGSTTNTSTEDGSTTVTVTPTRDGPTPTSGIAAIIAAVIVVVVISVLLLIIVAVLRWRVKKGQYVYDRLQDNEEAVQEQVMKSLLELYRALKLAKRKDVDVIKAETSISDSRIRGAVEHLRTLLKQSPVHIIKEELVNSLEILKWKEHDDIQGALDKLREIIPDMSSIDDTVKNIVDELIEKAESPFDDELQNTWDDLIDKLDNLIKKVEEAAPDKIKEILLKLCDELLDGLLKLQLSPEQYKVVSKFKISLESLKKVERLLTDEFVKGLKREGDDVKVKMLNTCVYSMPDGTEEGDFLVVNLVGRILEVLYIEIHEGIITKQDSKKFLIDEETKNSSQKVLFDYFADSVAKFIKDRNITKKLPLGFGFSFPVKQKSLSSGTITRWAKGFNITGTEGKDVVQLLRDAFERRGVIKVDVVALVSNTTGTLLSVVKEVPNCNIALTLDTGTNACYMESVNNVPKFKGDQKRYSQVIINTEWGAFGEDGKLDRWLRTLYDEQLDDEADNRGQQIYEKMISGKYLGEIVRLALKDLIGKGELFGGKSLSTKFDKSETFSTRRLSVIEGGDTYNCKKWFKDHFNIDASDKDCEVVQRVCEAVSTRAARLVASGVVALVKKINKIDGCFVAVDGSLYRKHPKFPERMKDALDELAPGNKIKMKLAKDGSGRGAAFAAAIACRLAAAGNHKSQGPVRSVSESETVDHKAKHFQDPHHIDRETMPATGDLYAVSERKPKKGSRKGPSDEELVAMHSIPDKSKRDQELTYAAIEVHGGAGGVHGGASSEYATIID